MFTETKRTFDTATQDFTLAEGLPENQALVTQRILQQVPGAIDQEKFTVLENITEGKTYWQDLVTFGRELQATHGQGELPLAQKIFSEVVSSESAVPAETRSAAKASLDAMNGKGSVAGRGEFLMGSFFEQMTDWKVIAPMLLASPVYQAGKLAALRGLGSAGLEGLTARGAAGFGGLVGETAFFSTAHRGLVHLTEGGVSWALKDQGWDFIRTGLTLGVLKGANFMGRLGVTYGLRLNEATPALWTGAQSRAMFWGGQASGYLGLVGSHALQEQLGLIRTPAGHNLWLGCLATYLALGLGGSAGRKLFGGPLAKIEHVLQVQTRSYVNGEGRNSGGRTWSEIISEWLPKISLEARATALAGPAGALMSVGPGRGSVVPEHIMAMASQDGKGGKDTQFPPATVPATPSAGKRVPESEVPDLSRPATPWVETGDGSRARESRPDEERPMSVMDRFEDGFPTSPPPPGPLTAGPEGRSSAAAKAEAAGEVTLSDLVHGGWATEVVNSDAGYSHGFSFRPEHIASYQEVTGNEAWLRRRIIPPAMIFMGASPATTESLKALTAELPESVPPTVVPVSFSLKVERPLFPKQLYGVITDQQIDREGNSLKVQQTSRIYEQRGNRSQVIATAESEYLVGAKNPEFPHRPMTRDEAELVPEVPLLEIKVDEAMADQAVEAYGEHHGTFASHEEAEKLGFKKGRVLPPTVMLNLADLAYQRFTRTLGMNQAHYLDVPMPGTAAPGDTLRFYVNKLARNYRIYALNQSDQVVFTAYTGHGTVERPKAVAIYSGIVSQDYGRVKNFPVDRQAGRQRVDEIISRFERPDMLALREVMAPRAEQSVFIAGVSDGMGLQMTAALLEAGHRNLVGVFYEPEAILLSEVMPSYKKALKKELDARGNSVSETDLPRIQKEVLDRVIGESDNAAGLKAILARLENVEGLKILAQKYGAHFQAVFQNLILARTGHSKGHLAMPQNVLEAVRHSVELNPWNQDLIVVNSIAFGASRPAWGRAQRTAVPSVDPVTGQIILMDQEPYHPRSFGLTLDAMGNNHRLMLNQLQEFFGPQSLSLFFSWPGGSQYAKGLIDIYGNGALGQAKILGESAAVAMQLASERQGYALGHHKVVSLPSFKSLALSKIPGGYVMGMIAEDVLKEKGVYLDMHQLGPRILVNALGGETVLENPAAHVDFAYAERTFFNEINARIKRFQRDVKWQAVGQRVKDPHWDGKAFDLETSLRLLEPILSPKSLQKYKQKYK